MKSPGPDYYVPHSAPDQPDDLPRQCPNCAGFLKHTWDFEHEVVSRREDYFVFYTVCEKCGMTVSKSY